MFILLGSMIEFSAIGIDNGFVSFFFLINLAPLLYQGKSSGFDVIRVAV